jgi:predicted heme/steroid binding protein
MISKYSIKIDRVAAWILFFAIIVYAITGYGMTKGIIDQQFSRSLHLGWLGIIGLITFVIHTKFAISMAFRRWGIWNFVAKISLAGFYLLLIIFFIYLQFFYQSLGPTLSQTKTANSNNESIATGTAAEIATTVFTTENLAKFNGLNGQPAYIAVNGIVYDVSNLFINGKHKSCSAGQDLTSEFYQVHSKNMLNSYAIVGTYKAD